MNLIGDNDRVLVFDLEANGLDDATKIHCLVSRVYQSDVHNSLISPTSCDIRSHLDAYNVLVGHNIIAYDLPLLKRLLGYSFQGRVIDTLILSRLIYQNNPPRLLAGTVGHSLAAWGERLGLAKPEHDEWEHFSAEMLNRCQQDVDIQTLLLNHFLEEVGDEWTQASRMTCKLFQCLQLQEERGWNVDAEHIDSCIHQLSRWIERIDNAVIPQLPTVCEVLEASRSSYVKQPLKKDGSPTAVVERYFLEPYDRDAVVGPFSRIRFRPIDLNSNKETKKVLLSQGWIPDEYNYSKTGEKLSPKFSKDGKYNGITSSLGRIISKRVMCKHRKGVLEGWKGNLRKDGRISPRVNGLAATGRLRHSVIVNVPSQSSGAFYAKQMRQVFIASPGMVMLGVDSKGNQIRQLAARMGDDEFTNAVLYGRTEDGTDFHSINKRNAGLPNRTLAKNFFYGYIFGAGDPKIARTIGSPVSKAKEYRNSFEQGLPSLRRLQVRLQTEWKRTAKPRIIKGRFRLVDGSLTGLDGRPVKVSSEHMCLNYTLQGDEAIQMSLALIYIFDRMDRIGYTHGTEWGSLIFMHDEDQMECIPEVEEDLGRIMVESIAWAGRFYNIGCPHEGELTKGMNWAETH